MTDSPTVPPPPRATKLLAGTLVARILLFSACVLILGVVPWLLSTRVARLNTLMSSGRVIEGKVSSSRTVSGKATSYYLTAQFDRDGLPVWEEREVPKYLYFNYSEDSAIPVVAMPNNPLDFEIGPVDAQRIANYKREFIPAIGLFGTLFVIFFIVSELSIYRDRRLLSQGELVTAHVVEAVYRGGKYSSTSVSYQYETAFGERTGKCRVPGNMASQYPVGKELQVLYRKDRDTVSAPVGMFQLVRLA